MKRDRRICLWALAASALSALPAGATSLRPVTLPEMVQQADRIFVGRAISEWTGRDERGLPATVTTFEVSRSIKGGPVQNLRVKHLGVTEIQPDGLATWVRGMPRYRRGVEYVVFLRPDSRFGFTSPVGLFQGAFEIRVADGNRRAAANGIENLNLLSGVGEDELRLLDLSSEEFPFVGRRRGPLSLDELVGMVDRIQTAQGGRRLQ